MGLCDMARELLGQITETIDDGGGNVVVRIIGSVVRATPKTGGTTFVRLEIRGEGTWTYTGDPVTFDFATEDIDPVTGNWAAE